MGSGGTQYMKIAILGAEAHGRDIAQICAVSGNEVRVHADDASDVMDSIDIIERRLDDAVDAGEMDTGVEIDVLDRLEATTGVDAAVEDADIVVDTVTDDVGDLQKRFASIEEFVDDETLITTSQPNLSVTAAAAGLRQPDRALGLEFHRPLDGPIVEVVVTDQTTETAVERVESFIEDFGGTALRIRDSPGLASGRLVLALEAEAMRLVDEGIAGVEAVDELLSYGYGHEMGPLEQADRAGLAGRLEILDHLSESVGDRFQPPDLLERLVANGDTGAEAGEGFYVWESGQPTEAAVDGPDLFANRELPDDPGL